MRLFLILSLAGCFAPKPPNGSLLCGDHDSCPDGYHCVESACWQTGTGPDLGVPVDDLSMPADLAGADFAGDDLAIGAGADLSTVDLAPAVLADTYLSDCVPAPEVTFAPEAHKRTMLSLNPSHTVSSTTTFYYLDTSCSQPAFTSAGLSSAVSETAGPTPDTRFLVITEQSIQWRPETSAIAQTFNSNQNCQYIDWAAGVFKDVTGRCSPQLPTTGTVFTAYLQIGNGTLETAGDATADASAPWPAFGPPLYHQTCKLTAPQTGCPSRCALPLTPGCVGSGSLAIGDSCDPRSDNCSAGTLCTPTPDGGPTPVCRQICNNANDCTQLGPSPAPSVKAACFQPLISVAQKLCTLNCNPIGSAASGCASDFKCRVFSLGQSNAHPDCVSTIGAGGDGASCSSSGDCAKGFDCVGTHCRAYCRTGMDSDCGGQTCVNSAGAGAFGTCCPSGNCS